MWIFGTRLSNRNKCTAFNFLPISKLRRWSLLASASISVSFCPTENWLHISRTHSHECANGHPVYALLAYDSTGVYFSVTQAQVSVQTKHTHVRAPSKDPTHKKVDSVPASCMRNNSYCFSRKFPLEAYVPSLFTGEPYHRVVCSVGHFYRQKFAFCSMQCIYT